MNNQKLAGKVAIVTGASKGIGAGIAKQLAAEGAAVVVNYSSAKEDADRVVDEITKRGGKAIAVQASVAKQAEVQRLFAAAKKTFGKIDVLVNNAGVYSFEPLEAVTEEEFHRQFNVNVLGLLLATQEAVKHFGAEGGSVINISSVASSATPPNSAIYTGTKGAVDAITRVLAKELGSKNVRVNAINPGLIETEGYEKLGMPGSDFESEGVAQTPLGRVGLPHDVAPVAVFLASEESAWITGETVRVAGGFR